MARLAILFGIEIQRDDVLHTYSLPWTRATGIAMDMAIATDADAKNTDLIISDSVLSFAR